MPAQTAYVPGVCNINRDEIAYRRKWRNIGAVSTIVLTVTLFIVSSNRWIRLSIFLPAFIAAIGYLQAKNKFCVSYAASGLQNAAEDSTKADKVSKEAHKLDQAKARKMNIQAALVALAITVLAVAA
ncbi:MAG TPA: hypothetical protein VN031_02655 [Candidatus Microsaccharimonas sp.]|nr:hypothetical protein [Candidatus Microsaccharimonas sp.]